jgi:hypothetical protein
VRGSVAAGGAACLLLTLLAVAFPPAPAAAGGTSTTATGDDRAAVDILDAVVEASRSAAYEGRVVVATFSERGPAVSEMRITQWPDGELRVTRGEEWELGRVAGEGYLRSSPDTLLRLSGVERTPFELDRLLRKYDLALGETTELDTGPARVVRVIERETGTRRERLHVDEASGLVVRRETFDRDGDPVRVMAFTRLETHDAEMVQPDEDDLEVERRALTPADTEQLREEGFVVLDELPAGYVLVEVHEVEDATVPTLHLIYSDGLYALSLYQQQGRLATSAVDGAARLTTDDGGHVWRWPGSEPRRVVWTGDRLTFTALTDAPTDELLTVASGLPTSRTGSILDRLARGLSRVGEWLTQNRSG